MTSSSNNNFVILTFYIIGISYVLNLMVDSIDDKIKFEFDKASVDEQLKAKNLQDKIGIGFKLSPSYDIDEFKGVLLLLTNKSDNLAVYVEWENCSFMVKHSGDSVRVIRLSPDLSRDLGVPQSPSIVAPTTTLAQMVTAENVFARDKETGIYKPIKPVVNISSLKNHPAKAKRKLYKQFISRRANLEFSLQLVIRVSSMGTGLAPDNNIPPMCIVNCPFRIKKLPWTYAFPWNKRRVS